MHTIILAAAAVGATLVQVQAVVPLASKRFKYPDGIPYKVDTDLGQPRGNQVGYNICNSTTQGPTSLCQTALFNSLDDFCFWAPPNPGKTVGDIEGEMVAWCTKPGHGTRVIPAGTISGVQLTRTPDYIQVVGFMDQTKINMLAGDWGGEMDPHGADLRGNPIGGIMFTDAFSGDYAQVVEWHNFMGANKFCLKACDQRRPNAAKYCEHIFDRIGCDYNAPSNARVGSFESCAGDSQDFPGVYTDSAGKVQTYTQPPESLGAITTIPYVARVPKSSQCSQFNSAELFSGSVTAPVPNAPAVPTSVPPSSTNSPSSVVSTSVPRTSSSTVLPTVTPAPSSTLNSNTTPPATSTSSPATSSPAPSPSSGSASKVSQVGGVGAISLFAALVQFFF